MALLYILTWDDGVSVETVLSKTNQQWNKIQFTLETKGDSELQRTNKIK